MIRMATVPSVAAQSAIASATAGSVGSTGLIIPNRPGPKNASPDRNMVQTTVSDRLFSLG